MPEQQEEKGPAIAVLHSYDPATGEVSTDVFTDRDEHYSGDVDPYHRAVALLNSVQGDFEGRIWTVGANEMARAQMTTAKMRGMGFTAEDWDDDRSLAALRGEL